MRATVQHDLLKIMIKNNPTITVGEAARRLNYIMEILKEMKR